MGFLPTLLSKTTWKRRFGRVKSFVLNMATSRPKPSLRKRYDAVQNGARWTATSKNLRNSTEIAILAHFERFFATPAARTKCCLLSKTPRAKAVLDTSDM